MLMSLQQAPHREWSLEENPRDAFCGIMAILMYSPYFSLSSSSFIIAYLSVQICPKGKLEETLLNLDWKGFLRALWDRDKRISCEKDTHT